MWILTDLHVDLPHAAPPIASGERARAMKGKKHPGLWPRPR